MAGVAPRMNGLARLDDGWALPLAGKHLAEPRSDFGLIFEVGEGDDWFEIRIETTASWVGSDHGIDFDPQENVPLEVLGLGGTEITRAVAGDEGRLEIVFATGRLTVRPSDSFEAWNFAGRGGVILTSLPNGGLAVWE